MIKVVISDLDGTLLTANHNISQRTHDTIKTLIADGIKFIIATGRHHSDVAPIVESLGGNIFYITSNGARVHDQNGNLFHSESIGADIVEDLIGLSRNYDVHCNIYDGDDWYVETPEEKLLGMHPESNFIYQQVNFFDLEHKDVSKVFFLGDHNTLQKLQTHIHQQHQEKVSSTFSATYLLEVMTQGVNKGNTLQKVLDYKNIDPQHAIAFGDGLNDFEMLRLVKHGVVMRNAHAQLKEKLVQFHEAPTNTEDGVAVFLKNYLK